MVSRRKAFGGHAPARLVDDGVHDLTQTAILAAGHFGGRRNVAMISRSAFVGSLATTQMIAAMLPPRGQVHWARQPSSGDLRSLETGSER
jgi:hypothetical protein